MEKHTDYKSLADSFFNKIVDYNFVQMDEEVAYEIAMGYIQPASVKFQSCKQDLNDRDDVLQEFNFELSKENFEILVNYMVIEWLTDNFITTGQALKASLSSSDFHSLQQSNMLAKALEVRATLLKENNQLAINHSHKKSSLYEMCVKRVKGGRLYESKPNET